MNMLKEVTLTKKYYDEKTGRIEVSVRTKEGELFDHDAVDFAFGAMDFQKESEGLYSNELTEENGFHFTEKDVLSILVKDLNTWNEEIRNRESEAEHEAVVDYVFVEA